MHGRGKFSAADGSVELGCYEAGGIVGQSVRWTGADGAKALELKDGVLVHEISRKDAAAIARRIAGPIDFKLGDRVAC